MRTVKKAIALTLFLSDCSFFCGAIPPTVFYFQIDFSFFYRAIAPIAFIFRAIGPITFIFRAIALLLFLFLERFLFLKTFPLE